MNIKETLNCLEELNIRIDTISIDTDHDTEFGECDISGIYANLIPVYGITKNNEKIVLYIDSNIAFNNIGKISGYC